MSQATDPDQQAEYWALLERIEDAGVMDQSRLGQAGSDLPAANLEEGDRAELEGLIARYRADYDRLTDPAEQGARGEGPLLPPPSRAVAQLDPDPEDIADAKLDAEDGFTVVGLPV